MSDIPEDIRAKAEALVDEYLLDDIDDLAAFIARALMAEREQCAKIADTFNCEEEDDVLEPEYATGRNVTAQFIAASIRRSPAKAE